MAFKYAERVQESSTSTGTGDLVLAGAPDSTYQTFSTAFANGDTTDVAIFGAGGFESCRATYNTGANSITRGTRYASSNGGAAVNFGAGTKTIIVSAPGALVKKLVEGGLLFTEAQSLSSPQQGVVQENAGIAVGMTNGTLSITVGSNAVTCALKGLDGNDPSVSNPVGITFRTATGGYVTRYVTAALSVVISNGSTLGKTVSLTPFHIWWAAIDTGSGVVLAAYQSTSITTGIYGPTNGSVVSSTAEGGAGAADSEQTFYSAAAQANKRFQWLGYSTWPGGLATAGVWAANYDETMLFREGMPTPGQVVRETNIVNSTQYSTASSAFQDTNLTGTLAMASPANGVSFDVDGNLDVSASVVHLYAQLYRGSVGVGSFLDGYTSAGGETFFAGHFSGLDLPGIGNPTYTIKIANSNNSTTVYFGVGNTNTTLRLKEIQA